MTWCLRGAHTSLDRDGDGGGGNAAHQSTEALAQLYQGRALWAQRLNHHISVDLKPNTPRSQHTKSVYHMRTV